MRQSEGVKSYQTPLVSPTNTFVCATWTQWPCWHDVCVCMDVGVYIYNRI